MREWQVPAKPLPAANWKPFCFTFHYVSLPGWRSADQLTRRERVIVPRASERALAPVPVSGARSFFSPVTLFRRHCLRKVEATTTEGNATATPPPTTRCTNDRGWRGFRTQGPVAGSWDERLINLMAAGADVAFPLDLSSRYLSLFHSFSCSLSLSLSLRWVC